MKNRRFKNLRFFDIRFLDFEILSWLYLGDGWEMVDRSGHFKGRIGYSKHIFGTIRKNSFLGDTGFFWRFSKLNFRIFPSIIENQFLFSGKSWFFWSSPKIVWNNSSALQNIEHDPSNSRSSRRYCHVKVSENIFQNLVFVHFQLTIYPLGLTTNRSFYTFWLPFSLD